MKERFGKEEFNSAPVALRYVPQSPQRRRPGSPEQVAYRPGCLDVAEQIFLPRSKSGAVLVSTRGSFCLCSFAMHAHRIVPNHINHELSSNVKGASRGDNGVAAGLADRERTICCVAHLGHDRRWETLLTSECKNGPSSLEAGAVNFTSGRGWGLKSRKRGETCGWFVDL